MRHCVLTDVVNLVTNAVECSTNWNPPLGFWKKADPNGLGWPGCTWDAGSSAYIPPTPEEPSAPDYTDYGKYLYPIGSIYTSIVATNPATLFGFGTWAAFGAGRVLIGLSTADVDFDTAEETGGAKASSALIAHTHAITDPGHVHLQNAHSHTQDAHTHVQNSHTHVQDAHTHVQNSHTHPVTSQTATTGAATSYEHGTLDTSSADAEATEVTGATTAVNQNATATNQAATAVNQNATATNQTTIAVNSSAATGISGTGSAGSGASFSLMNPYVVVFMWKRTA